MKLIIQIPCFNEAETLPSTIADLPRQVPGFDDIEFLVIDDGSTDGTHEVANELGVHHIHRLPQNRGLAYAFALGLETALKLGADVIVNTDGDNQYQGEYIKDLIRPIMEGEAEMVIGDRQIDRISHFSPMKKMLQKIGSWVVRWASGTDIPDATSGFRAFSRKAALQLVVFSSYTYTLETIIQAGKKGISIFSIPVATNTMLRESRLIRSMPRYVIQSAATILRIFLMYEPMRVFLTLGTIPLIAGSILLLRFGYFYFTGDGAGHIQSLIVASILIVLGLLTFLLGMLADLIARNRRLTEEINYRIRRMDLEDDYPANHSTSYSEIKFQSEEKKLKSLDK
ncbi:MAG: glycosyltransferase family 2 protein [Anaerolineaceae bacterium]|nr:MAG: glycosyltransferase family 2 protein [Anaerolineaceae bacterium]